MKKKKKKERKNLFFVMFLLYRVFVLRNSYIDTSTLLQFILSIILVIYIIIKKT